jgi:hypothetical protein
VSWTEYFGAQPKNCAKIPWAKAQFDYPTADNGSVQIASHTPTVGFGDCPGYSQIYQIPGADVQEMGRQPAM